MGGAATSGQVGGERRRNAPNRRSGVSEGRPAPGATTARSGSRCAIVSGRYRPRGNRRGAKAGGRFGRTVLRRMPQGPDGSSQVTMADATLVRVDRKSTRLNSSHLVISYAVFCL